ncbi:hypothetical protein [Maribellus mangrovi]|uniref:hypothetical protein n=1 Tax=Maribellus mangrovi TaxID=3133146 RepID=UPI0030ED9803
MKRILLVFCIVFLIFSCEKDDLTGSDTLDSQDLLLKSGKPNQPGDNLKVFRYQGETVGYVIYDEKSNLMAFVGGDVREFCSGGWDVDILNLQEIVLEDGGDFPRVIQLKKGDEVRVQVYNLSYWDCDILASTEPVFVGKGHYVFTDNDAFAWDGEGNNTNVYGFRLNGDGVTVIWHVMWDGEDFWSSLKHNEIVKLK